MKPDLSVLICSLHERTASLARLLSCIAEQDASLLARTQVLVDIDGGAVTTGVKRQRLLDASTGRYVVFIDDDDLVTGDYLAEVFAGIDKGVDHIGVRMVFVHQTEHTRTEVECSMRHTKWVKRGGRFLRSAQHVCAVKRELALAAGFSDRTIGEDRDYASRLNPLISSEHLTSHPVYVYLWEPKRCSPSSYQCSTTSRTRASR